MQSVSVGKEQVQSGAERHKPESSTLPGLCQTPHSSLRVVLGGIFKKKKNTAIPHPRVSVAVTPARLLHQHLQLLLVTTESVHSFGEKRILYHL